MILDKNQLKRALDFALIIADPKSAVGSSQSVGIRAKDNIVHIYAFSYVGFIVAKLHNEQLAEECECSVNAKMLLDAIKQVDGDKVGLDLFSREGTVSDILLKVSGETTSVSIQAEPFCLNDVESPESEVRLEFEEKSLFHVFTEIAPLVEPLNIAALAIDKKSVDHIRKTIGLWLRENRNLMVFGVDGKIGCYAEITPISTNVDSPEIHDVCYMTRPELAKVISLAAKDKNERYVHLHMKRRTGTEFKSLGEFTLIVSVSGIKCGIFVERTTSKDVWEDIFISDPESQVAQFTIDSTSLSNALNAVSNTRSTAIKFELHYDDVSEDYLFLENLFNLHGAELQVKPLSPPEEFKPFIVFSEDAAKLAKITKKLNAPVHLMLSMESGKKRRIAKIKSTPVNIVFTYSLEEDAKK